MAYKVASDVIRAVRTLLLDEDSLSYRYSDASLYDALNAGLLEMRRIRPEFFRATNMVAPQYATTDGNKALGIDPMYVPSLIYFTTGWAQLRDSEEATDARATQFLQAFDKKLVSTP